MRGDLAIMDMIKNNRLIVDQATGLIYAPHSNTPGKPAGGQKRTRKAMPYLEAQRGA